MSAHSAIKDRDNAFSAATLPSGLTDLFGVELDSFQTYQPPSRDRNAVQFGKNEGGAVPVRVFAEVLRATTGRIVGRWRQDYLRGMPAATERQVGTGKAVYYGSLFNLESARYLMQRYAGEQGLRPLLMGIPRTVEVTRRVKDGREYYFLLNHGEAPAAIRLRTGFVDLVTSTAAPRAFTLQPFDYRVLARDRRNSRRAISNRS
jgi:beta-galactosidase